jgi:hypothetical protein
MTSLCQPAGGGHARRTHRIETRIAQPAPSTHLSHLQPALSVLAAHKLDLLSQKRTCDRDGDG